MQRFEFHLDISAESFLAYYRGSARQVVVRSTAGPTVQFPALLLRPFVTPTGIQGTFVLTCDDEHRGAVLKRR